jgi:tetratricopeptide (TPR) repeat protein
MEEVSLPLGQMVLSTPEDYLFKGQWEAMLHPERELRTLDEAVRRRNSIMARAIRSEARANRALFTGEIADAESALADAGAARIMLPDNPYVLAQSVFAQLVAASIYDRKGQPRNSQRVLEQARPDAQKLKRFTSSPIALKVCLWYFDYVGEEESALETARHGTEFRHVCLLYRRGDYRQALQAAERAVARNIPLSHIERVFVLAEVDRGRARAQSAVEHAVQHPDNSRFSSFCASHALYYLGMPQAAAQASSKIRQRPAGIFVWREDWYLKHLDYNCGRITEEGLLKFAAGVPPPLCEAHFLIGLRLLSEGDRVGAREHFQKCCDTRIFIYWDYTWARAFLKRLELDPAWPPWIPGKE